MKALSLLIRDHAAGYYRVAYKGRLIEPPFEEVLFLLSEAKTDLFPASEFDWCQPAEAVRL